ncbi:MAG: hypothetical protein KDD35_02105 [Bdellovibrionales bacterium]|nr:hypothetical protein [Bdellovibrionales bacterium]
MAYKQGGILGLEKALKAQTVNTIELNSGLQISGVLDTYLSKEVACLHEPTFVRLRGPAQLCIKGSQIQGHGTHYHFQGFSSPLGLLRNEAKCLSIMDSQDLLRLGLVIGYRAHLEFASGIELIGTVTKITRGKGKIILISFESCTVRQNENILFQPDWGIFDLAVGHTITSIFGGPADRVHYNHLDDFVAKRVRPRKIPSQKLKEFELYQFIRQFRSRADSTSDPHTQLEKLIDSYFTNFSSNWLAGVELLELSVALNSKKNCQHLEEKLMESKNQKPEVQQCITEGIRLAHQVPCLLGKNGS